MSVIGPSNGIYEANLSKESSPCKFNVRSCCTLQGGKQGKLVSHGTYCDTIRLCGNLTLASVGIATDWTCVGGADWLSGSP